MADSLSATSNGGGTTHVYGVKVDSDALGTDGKIPAAMLPTASAKTAST